MQATKGQRFMISFLSLTGAAKACGKSRPTIQKAVKSGKISATQDENGHWQIDPSELNRVYPLTAKDAGSIDSNLHPPNVQNESVNNAVNVEVKLLQETIARLEGDKEDLRADRDAWKSQAQTLALSDQRPKEDKRGFFGRLFNR